MDIFQHLKIGDLIVVRYGRSGEQLAAYFRPISYVGYRRLRVHKWRTNSRSWTNPVTIERREILRFATAADLKKFKHELGPTEHIVAVA